MRRYYEGFASVIQTTTYRGVCRIGCAREAGRYGYNACFGHQRRRQSHSLHDYLRSYDSIRFHDFVVFQQGVLRAYVRSSRVMSSTLPSYQSRHYRVDDFQVCRPYDVICRSRYARSHVRGSLAIRSLTPRLSSCRAKSCCQRRGCDSMGTLSLSPIYRRSNRRWHSESLGGREAYYRGG